MTNAAFYNTGIQPERQQIEDQYKKSNNTRRTIGTVLMILGVLPFALPFFFVFAKAGSNGSVSVTEMGCFTILFNVAPAGLIVAIVGAILRK